MNKKTQAGWYSPKDSHLSKEIGSPESKRDGQAGTQGGKKGGP